MCYVVFVAVVVVAPCVSASHELVFASWHCFLGSKEKEERLEMINNLMWGRIGSFEEEKAEQRVEEEEEEEVEKVKSVFVASWGNGTCD